VSALPGDSSEHLAFLVGEDEYAVPILKVREIVAVGSLTRVPGAPPWVRGVANLRGQVLPVVDLAAKFGLPAAAATTRACIVVFDLALDQQVTAVGALVAEVTRVLDLSAAAVEPPPAFGTQIQVEYLVGAAPEGDRFVLLLDVDRVLTANEILAMSALGEASVAAETAAGGAR
jgi:purine-binding chemotaxis protein CheW